MKPDWKTCLRIGLCILLVYLGIHYLPSAVSLLGLILGALAPIITGFIIAYIVNILMSFYERHYFSRWAHTRFVAKTRRTVCLILALITLVGILALVIWLVIPELISCLTILISEVPSAVENLIASAAAHQQLPEALLTYLQSIDWQATLAAAASFLLSGLGDAATILLNTVTSVVSGTTTFLLGMIFALYMLANKDTLLRQLNRVIDAYIKPRWNLRLRHWHRAFHHSFHRYIVGQCTEALILGSLCVAGMLLLRLPYAGMIGALMGVTAFIPIVGAFLGAIIGALMILTVSPTQALVFLVFTVILQQLEGNLIYPRIVGNSLGLPAIWVLAAVTVGSSLMGIPGMLLGVPTAAALYQLLKEAVQKREGSVPEADLSLLYETPIPPAPKKKKHTK